MLIGKNPLNESPKWFTRNIEIEPENNSVEVDGASINFNVWGLSLIHISEPTRPY